MVYFCAMSKRFNIVILITFLSAGVLTCHAQQQPQTGASKSIYLTPMCVYNGDTIPYVKLPPLHLQTAKIQEQARNGEILQTYPRRKESASNFKGNQPGDYRDLRIFADHSHSKRAAKAPESCGKGVERTIHSPYEKTFLCTRKTVNQTGRPANPFHFLRTGKSIYGTFKAGFYRPLPHCSEPVLKNNTTLREMMRLREESNLTGRERAALITSVHHLKLMPALRACEC